MYTTLGLTLSRTGHASQGATALWQATAPAGLSIIGANVPAGQLFVFDVNDGGGYGGGFYWQSGGATVKPSATSFSQAFAPSNRFGFQLICGQPGGCSNSNTYEGEIAVEDIGLTVQESSGPSTVALGSNNLWYQSGWVRGPNWPISFQATDPSGVCATGAWVNGQPISGPGAAPNHIDWKECPDQTMSQQIDTRSYPDGPLSLTLSAANAAGVFTTATRDGVHGSAVLVDNQPVTLSLSGPTDAPSTAGAQYVTAAATAGPSGVSGIACSVDGGALQWFGAASARVAVQGVGVHQFSCAASNNARDASGRLGTSALASWTLSIRQPSVASVSFSTDVAKLQCRKVRERVKVPGQWVTVRVHGQPVRVRVPAQVRTRTRLRCHGRSVSRARSASTERIRFGTTASISGWLGTANGDALAGQRVRILTAPDNGGGAFLQVLTADTSADGTWSARLPPGPSRIVEAVYDGSSTVEPSMAAPARLIVPASVTLAIAPRHTRWGRTIVISGRLHGGYVPPAGELVVLHVGWPGGSTEVGHVYASADGRFRTRYTFLRGNGSQTYRFWAATASESDYPYAPGTSWSVAVSVSP